MGPGLLMALETYVKTMEDGAEARAEDKLAQAVCEQLHAGPAKGLKCLSCYNAEAGVPEMLKLEAEREIGERQEMLKGMERKELKG
jgi:hypothetical protein